MPEGRFVGRHLMFGYRDVGSQNLPQAVCPGNSIMNRERKAPRTSLTGQENLDHAVGYMISIGYDWMVTEIRVT